MLINELNVANHQYRYLTTLGRLIGADGKYGRGDAEEGQVFIQESSSNAKDGDTDYSEKFTINYAGKTYLNRDGDSRVFGNQMEVSIPTSSRNKGTLWTHFCVYRTTDLLDPETDLGNASETYIWSVDIPIVKQFYIITIDSDSVVSLSDSMSSGYFCGNDIGSVVTTMNDTPMIIVDIIDSLHAKVTDINGKVFSYTAIQSYASIGGGKQFTFSREEVDTTTSEYTITSHTFTFTDDMIGKQLVCSSGETSLIKYIRTESGETVLGVDEINGEPTYKVGVISPTSRIFTDTTTDKTLRGRKESGEPLYFLETRFFDALPNGRLSAIAGGSYFTAPYKKSEYYYSSLRNLFRTGYYHPAFQFNDKPVGSITRLSEYPNALVVFGKNFTYYLDPTIVRDAGENRVGEYIPTYSDPRLITDRIGVYSEGNAVKIDNGGEAILTGEPAVRFFDGHQYSANLADESVQNSRISTFLQSVIMRWDKRQGLKITGLAKTPISEVQDNSFMLIYYGESLNETLTETQVKALRANKDTDTFVGIYDFIAGGYNYICYPSVWGDNFYAEDNSNGFNIAYPEPQYSIMQIDGIDYNIFRTSNVLNGIIDFNVKEI